MSNIGTALLSSKHYSDTKALNNKTIALKDRLSAEEGRRKLNVVKRFLTNLRVLRNNKPSTRQDLKYSIKLAKAIQETYMFLSQNYFKDNNTDFDLYKAIVDLKYGIRYMSNFSVNNTILELYLKPRGINIFFNTGNSNVEAVFNNTEFVDLHYDSINDSDPHSIISNIGNIRNNIAKEYRSVAHELGKEIDDEILLNLQVAHVASYVAVFRDAIIKQWIADKSLHISVENFIYAYTTPHCLRTIVNDGFQSINFDRNPTNLESAIKHADSPMCFEQDESFDDDE